MSTEFQTLMLPIDSNLEGQLRKISSEGWACVPGTFPVAIYNLQRETEQHVIMGIDDSLVTVVKGNGH